MTKRLSEYAISLVGSCARFHGQGVDGLIVLQGPAQLQRTVFVLLPHNLKDVVEVQHGHSQLSVLALDPEHQTPQSGDLPAIEEHLQQTKQADPPVETLEQWVDVGKDYADRRWFVLVIDEESQVGIREGHHALMNLQPLPLAQGDDTPVGGPGVIVDLLDPGNLGVLILETKSPDVDAFFPGDPSSQTIHPLGKPVIAIDQEGDQVVLLGETDRFD